MSLSPGPSWMLEFDVVGVSVGAALLSGVLALVGPFLGGVTVALAALAWADWTASLRTGRVSLGTSLRSSGGGALLATAAGLAFYGFAPPTFSRVRALAVAVSLLPLWWSVRHTPGRVR